MAAVQKQMTDGNSRASATLPSRKIINNKQINLLKYILVIFEKDNRCKNLLCLTRIKYYFPK